MSSQTKSHPVCPWAQAQLGLWKDSEFVKLHQALLGVTDCGSLCNQLDLQHGMERSSSHDFHAVFTTHPPSVLAFPSNYSFWILNFVSRVSSIGTLNQILKVFAFPPLMVTYFKYKVNFSLTLDVLKCSLCCVWTPDVWSLSAPNVFTPFPMGAQLISSLIIYRYSQPNIINRK